ncbi:sulfatase-like hydrolase/transferase [uncultured Flavobacterium sp.]|uniref:sulfatase-like hydrolase/transferase n=1 Tax=uncultured Flavobacterium sp. TaxID=165435 RepID=UPI0029305AA8|nr:sulfatase-like hydrolase/transferase [uncultured Flavobacterium sp.]
MIAVTIYLFLNFLLFVPLYFFNKETSTFSPINQIFRQKSLRLAGVAVFARMNKDIFRLNIEFTIVILLLSILKNYINFQYIAVPYQIYYILTLIVFYYHYSIYGIYNTFPAINSDFQLIIEGLKIAWAGYKKQLLLGIGVFLILLVLIIKLNTILLGQIQNTNVIILKILASIIIFIPLRHFFFRRINYIYLQTENHFEHYSGMEIQALSFLISSNIFFSKKAKSEIDLIPQIYNKTKLILSQDQTLKQSPNIYFIALESYGAILYENEAYTQPYIQLLETMHQKIQNDQWHVTSFLSNSPVSGGGSWMAFFSILKGIQIKTDSLYRKLVQLRDQYPVQSIFTVLKKFQYNTFLVSGIGGFENLKVPWKEILEFADVQDIVTHKDLNYIGPLFIFESAPDQYFLNRSIQIMKEKSQGKPLAFFVETLNSHYDFYTPTVLLDQWEDCNTTSLEDYRPTDSNNNNKENYFEAIKYQLKTIENLIVNEPEDTIFVIFGDHQPPMITTDQNSFKTPVHIISKNKDFIELWHQKKFSNNLIIDIEKTPIVHHHELKNLFLECFLQQYSV